MLLNQLSFILSSIFPQSFVCVFFSNKSALLKQVGCISQNLFTHLYVDVREHFEDYKQIMLNDAKNNSHKIGQNCNIIDMINHYHSIQEIYSSIFLLIFVFNPFRIVDENSYVFQY